MLDGILADMVGEHPHDDVAVLADMVGEHPHDDVAVLAVGFPPGDVAGPRPTVR